MAKFGKRENLNIVERGLELFIIAAMLLLYAFLRIHEAQDTGFFTEAFGPREALALYAPILLSLAAPSARALTGRRNLGRPFEVLANLGLAVGSLWLFTHFPFDFSHLGDPLPAFMRWPIAWFSDWFARIVLAAQVVFGLIGAVTNFVQFLVRGRAVG
jgi:hypothetical protein